MLDYRDKLNNLGHEAIVHPDYQAFIKGEKLEIWKQVMAGEHHQAKRQQGYIRWYYREICASAAVLILNFDKGDTKNYIGGNTLMEIAFAYVNNKKIFLINPIPETVSYYDEIRAMVDESGQVINDDLNII